MADLFPLPAELQQVEYVRLYFHLEIVNYFDLPPSGLLQLRRELLQALKGVPSAVAEQIKRLLQPSAADDLLLRRRFMKPAPGFVLSPDPGLQGLCEPKQRIILPILLLGLAVRECPGLILLFEQLGEQGLHHGTGQFRLEAVECEDAGGLRSMLWQAGESKAGLQPQICDLHWWLGRQPLCGAAVELEVISPMRLLRQGRPLFQADFADIFPFLLRRVTAMLACHAGVEPVDDPAGLISLAGRIETRVNRLRWYDWRRLAGDHRQQDFGGLLGTLHISGPGIAEVAWLLQLGQLLQLGKGAAYGAGQYRLQNL